MNLNKVIIPVAGLGTRILPATKAIPKEMLPIVDKPIIQYVVEECISAGFKEIILITHSSKNSIENHFDTSFELESTLEKRIKKGLLKEIRLISRLNINITSIRQAEAKGLGHAILQAKNIVGMNPFAVVLPDRVMNQNTSDLKNSNLSKMRRNFLKYKKSIILFEKVKKSEVSKFGIASISKNKISDDLKLLNDLVEKPSGPKAPSRMAAVGRYIFEPDIFNFIDTKAKRGKEIELTDAIKKFIESGKEVYASPLEGECFDCGSKEGYFEAIYKTSLKHKDIKRKVRQIISQAR